MSTESLATRVYWALRIATAAPREGRLPFSRRRIDRSARRHLRGAVEHAYRYVPHYRELFDARGLRSSDFTSTADLARLPILERSELQADPERFVSTALPREELIELRTGGSSGEPVAIYHDPAALFEGAIHRERRRAIYIREANRRVRLRVMSFGTKLSSGRVTAREFSRRSLIPRSIRLVGESRSLLAPFEENVRAIERFKPDVLGGHGSYLEALMDYIGDRGGASHMPKLLVYGGDAVSDRARHEIPRRFGTAVYGSYAAIEAFHLGFECDAHRGYHMNVDLYPTRLVDAEGREVGTGESGDVVVSNLVHRGTVLLNYRLGDRAHWLGEPCPCGRKLPLLSHIEGRIDDWLEMPDGTLLHPQAFRGHRGPLSEEIDRIRSYQLEQRSPAELLLRIVPVPDLAEGERGVLAERLRANLGEVVGERVEIEVDFVAELPRTARGKVRTVISPSSRRRAAGAGDLELRPARPDELEAILAVMEPANMHRVDSPEMPRLELDRFTVAELDGELVGAAGWELLEPELAKTTLLSVLPRVRGRGVGEALQRARMEQMARAGARRVRTNADRPATIAWYKREFDYEEVGRLPKEDAFGDPEIAEWTTLEAPLPTAAEEPSPR